MGTVAFFFIFIFIFWVVHFTKRVFKHTYRWQIKEYRWDRMKAFIKEKGIARKSWGTFIAFGLVVFSILLLKYIYFKPFYIFILAGFCYFVVSFLNVLTAALNKSLTVPKKSARNLIIVGLSMIVALLPLILSLIGYMNFRSQTGEFVDTSGGEVAEITAIFPREEFVSDETTTEVIQIIPLETAITLLFFLQLFLVDLFLPAFVSLFVFLTSFLAQFSRKKK